MRPMLLCCLALVLAAGEAPALPATTQKLVDDATASAAKARQAYDAALKKEQEKLTAALTKEQERETKKGNLDGALAIKALIGEVELGLLQKRSGEQSDLLGDQAISQIKGAPATASPPAALLTDCPLPSSAVRLEGVPVELTAFFDRATALRLPQGDPKRYQFGTSTPGLVVAVTLTRPRFAEVRADLERNGFQRLEGGSENYAWYVLTVKTGDRFTASGPGEAWFATHIFAASFKQVH